MPVRLLKSSVLKWPDPENVESALRHWVTKVAEDCPELIAVGYFGSYANKRWGVGSDLDVVILLKECDLPFTKRAVDWNLSTLPVPVDALVYTLSEWESLKGRGGMPDTIRKEVKWVYHRFQANGD